ncbi:MAG: TonB family protein [Bacteroidales bacterium]
MNHRQEEYNKQVKKKGKRNGIILTILFHLVLICCGFSSGFKYKYPPPKEQGILIEFTDDEIAKPIQVKTGHEPRANQVEKNKDVRLVQKSESSILGEKASNGVETTVDNQGDVEVPEPPRKKIIIQKALFSSAKNKSDTLATQVADKISDGLKAGHSQGNTKVGNVEGTPRAKLKGRSIMGNLPTPNYDVENEGEVVVKIKVDQYGKVIDASIDLKGTTVTDNTLWKAAIKAAKKAEFNISSSAPTVQLGSITYIFKLH